MRCRDFSYHLLCIEDQIQFSSDADPPLCYMFKIVFKKSNNAIIISIYTFSPQKLFSYRFTIRFSASVPKSTVDVDFGFMWNQKVVEIIFMCPETFDVI